MCHVDDFAFCQHYVWHKLPSQKRKRFWIALAVLAGTVVAVQFKVVSPACLLNFFNYGIAHSFWDYLVVICAPFARFLACLRRPMLIRLLFDPWEKSVWLSHAWGKFANGFSNGLPISCVVTFLQPLLATLECVCDWSSVPLRGHPVHDSHVSPIALCGRFLFRSCLATCCHWLALSIFPGFSKCASK